MADPEGSEGDQRLPGGLAARLSRYRLVLIQAKAVGQRRISSNELGRHARVNSTQVRRDLSRFGKFGRRGAGYKVDLLLAELQRILGLRRHRLLLIGVGPLGEALVDSPLLAASGLELAAILDLDLEQVGRTIGSMTVGDYGQLAEVVGTERVEAALIGVPPASLQRVADDLIAAGITVILNASEGLMHVPEGVALYPANPAAEIASALCVHFARHSP